MRAAKVAVLSSIIAAACLLAALYMAITTPSCEEQGKKTKFQYFMPLVQMVGKVPVTQMMPVYACK